MVVPVDRTHLLAAVERSPQAFAVHDRDGWVRAFTADARVEDPVGSRPHVGYDEIYRFYDTFIGPRDIKFHRDLDIVFGTVVLRDLELEVAMGASVTMRIPAFLRYDLREANGEWRIAALRAYWELPAMVLQFLRTGSRAISPGLELSRNLLSNQGLKGAAGFMTGFRRVGARHKELVGKFLRAVTRGDKFAAARALSSTAAITLGDNDPVELAELVEQLNGACPGKTIGAGPTVAVSVNSAHGRGIVFADVAWRGNAITRIRYFPA
jgi:Nuclear transport factor 2 (NTF2) domain